MILPRCSLCQDDTMTARGALRSGCVLEMQSTPTTATMNPPGQGDPMLLAGWFHAWAITSGMHITRSYGRDVLVVCDSALHTLRNRRRSSTRAAFPSLLLLPPLFRPPDPQWLTAQASRSDPIHMLPYSFLFNLHQSRLWCRFPTPASSAASPSPRSIHTHTRQPHNR